MQKSKNNAYNPKEKGPLLARSISQTDVLYYTRFYFPLTCNLTEPGIELHSLPHPQIGCDIFYQDVKWVEMFVIRRVWGTAWTTIIAPNFNLDFIVHTWDHDLEIEIPACYEEIGRASCRERVY